MSRTRNARVPRRLPLGRHRRFLITAHMVSRIYGGYKAIQLLGRLVGEQRVDALYRRQHRHAPRLVYRTATRLEGLLIKACQFLSARADILPGEYVEVLSQLQDRVPARPFAEIAAVIEHDLGHLLSTVFAAVDEQPLASASLAQVHRARLHEGREVAVKVQYPDIAHTVSTDLANLTFFINMLARLERNLDLRIIIREVSKYVRLELDFEHEAANAERIRANLQHRTDVIVPQVLREYSRKRVLVMQYLPGIKITDVAALAAAGIDKHDVARVLSEIFCHQILVDGFFHADPHPGNILVQPGPKLVLLDFGLAKDFPPGFQLLVAELVAALIEQNPARIVAAFRALGFRTRSDDGDSLVALGNAVLGEALRSRKAYADQELIDQINRDLPRVLRANPIVEAPSHLLLVMRVMGLLSGIGKQLDSHVDPLATLLPFVTAPESGVRGRASGAGDAISANT